MKIVTVRNISFGPYIRWSVIAYTLFGVLTGFLEAVFGYIQTGSNLAGYLFWYGLGTLLIHLAVGLIGGSVFVLLYNGFNRSFGSYRIEVDVEEINDSTPPPPPADLNAAI